MADYHLITTTEEVEEVAGRLSRERVIGIDTEADSFFHYFDKLCLLQIAGKSGIYLIDPLALPPNGLAPLAPILADPEVRTIFHAADYDLYVLQRYGDLRVRNIFDTMISSQMLGYPAVGLGALVERHFGIKLSKDQQRTDWSRRPLRPVQIEYAASDVLYLARLATILEKELKAKERLSWAQSEFRHLEERVWPERKIDKDAYLRIKGAKKLSPRGLAILRELFLVRDARARELDKPAFKVLGNGTLLDLAQNPPASRRTLGRRKGITELVLRRLGQEIHEAIERGREAPEPAPTVKGAKRPIGGRRRLDHSGEERLEQLKRWRGAQAREFDMDPGVLCPNAVLETVAWANPRSHEDLERIELLRGWRLQALGDKLLGVLEKVRTPGTAATPANPPGSRKKSAGKPRQR